MTFILGVFIGQAASTCPHDRKSARTSDRSSWPPGFNINDRKIVLNFSLLLDMETPRYKGFDIVSGGRLIFSPTAPTAKLVTDYLKVHSGGFLEIGSEDCPFEGNAHILLTGKRGAYESVDGEKFISVHEGGSLEIHGKPKLSWTKLSQTAKRGGILRTIFLLDDVSSWMPGDKLVLASTDFDFNQAEVVTVKKCTGKSCTVQGPLEFDHFGEIDSGVDMRGEVGLLTRNIVINSFDSPYRCD